MKPSICVFLVSGSARIPILNETDLSPISRDETAEVLRVTRGLHTVRRCAEHEYDVVSQDGHILYSILVETTPAEPEPDPYAPSDYWDCPV